jgi:hypothetical protein
MQGRQQRQLLSRPMHRRHNNKISSSEMLSNCICRVCVCVCKDCTACGGVMLGDLPINVRGTRRISKI